MELPGTPVRETIRRCNPLTLIRSGLDWLLPARCQGCERPINPPGNLFCGDCYAQLPFQHHCCRRCGQVMAASQDLCGACLQHPPAFDRCFCAFRYEHPVADQLCLFKYGPQPQKARALARLLAAEISTHGVELPQLLIPVPLHAGKLRQRGFNQAWQLARHLARELHIPCSDKLIAKSRATAPQAELKWKQRRTNVRGCFTLKNPPEASHIALVDDVVTTGSTAAEISKILKKNGVDYVQVWAVAHTV